MIHPDTDLIHINDTIGHGLVATRLIPKGTITWVRDPLDLVLEPAAYNDIQGQRKDFLYKYCFVDGKGHHILCWDHGRFVNHCCEANCIAPGFDFEIAVRDIQPREQLTCDYGLLNVDQPFTCSCGAAHCRKVVKASDPIDHHQKWDAQVKQVFSLVNKLPQPLWDFVSEKEEVIATIDQNKPVPSCFVHYYASEKHKFRS
jgi:hypothetical protein